MAYVGTPLDTTNAFQSLAGKRFSGDGSTTDFTLDSSPNSTLDIEVFVGNVRQDPNSAYTISGTTLTFTGAPPSGTNNIYVVHQAKSVGTIDVPSSFEDNARSFKGGVVFNEDSADVDFRIEDNNNANAFFVEGGASAGQPLIGIGTGSPEGEIHTMCSGIGQSLFDSYDGNTGELALRTSRNATVGSHTLSNSGDGGRLRQYVSDGNSFEVCAQIELGADANAADGDVPGHILFHTTPDGGTLANIVEVMRMTSTQEISTGAETAPDVDAGGICIDHNANDTNAMTFKNSDVAHGMTTNAETDTYAEFTKCASAQGGFRIRGLSDSSGYSGLDLFGDMGGASNTAEATHVNGVIHIDGAIKDGTDRGAMGADENTVCIKNAGTTEVIFKGDGEIFSNQSATVGTFDAYEDAQLIRAYDLSHMRGVINSKFDKFVQYNQKDLADARLIGKDENGNPTSFVNWTGMSRLHNGAIWQQYEKHNQLLEAVYDLAKEAVGEEKANAILDKHEVKRLQ